MKVVLVHGGTLDAEPIRSVLIKHFTRTEVVVVEVPFGDTKPIKQAGADVILFDDTPHDSEHEAWYSSLRNDKLTHHIPIILLSSRRSAKNHERWVELGVDGIIEKPINPAILITQICALARIRQAESAARQGTAPVDAARPQATAVGLSQLDPATCKSLITQAMDSIILADVNGTILDVNPAFTQITGYTRSEVVGQPTSMLTSDNHKAELHKQIWEALRLGEVWRGRLANRRKDGTLCTVETKVVRLCNEQGETICYAANERDITLELELEEKLRQAQKSEAIGHLTSGIAHDFNNLLQGILGFIEIILEETAGQPHIQESLIEIQNAAQRATRLTRQLLSFSRKNTSQPTVLSLNAHVESLKNILSHILGEQVSIRHELHAQRDAVYADPGQLEQVIINLCINARDAMKQGGTITLATEQIRVEEAAAGLFHDSVPGRYVRLSVTDVGSGISESDRQHIFEPFFTTKEIGKGTGLGLSVVLGIVKEHNGWIDVESELGKGTVFHIYLPEYQTELTAAAGLNKLIVREKPFSGELTGKGECILVIENEDIVRHLAVRTLTNAGYRVLSAASIAEARDFVKAPQHAIRLVFSDIVLNDGSGIDFAGECRLLKPELPMLLCSNSTPHSDDIRVHALKDRTFDFVSKPYDIPDLLRRIRVLLQGG